MGGGGRSERVGANASERLVEMNSTSGSRVQVCKWFVSCPIRQYTEAGKLERCWVESYSLVSNEECVRFQMESQGLAHPDTMLPDGEIRDGLE